MSRTAAVAASRCCWKHRRRSRLLRSSLFRRLKAVACVCRLPPWPPPHRHSNRHRFGVASAADRPGGPKSSRHRGLRRASPGCRSRSARGSWRSPRSTVRVTFLTRSLCAVVGQHRQLLDVAHRFRRGTDDLGQHRQDGLDDRRFVELAVGLGAQGQRLGLRLALGEGDAGLGVAFEGGPLGVGLGVDGRRPGPAPRPW